MMIVMVISQMKLWRRAARFKSNHNESQSRVSSIKKLFLIVAFRIRELQDAIRLYVRYKSNWKYKITWQVTVVCQIVFRFTDNLCHT